MNALPVIVRELRSESRLPLNYWLRVVGVGVMLITAGIVVVNLEGRIAGKGDEMFNVLQPTLFSLVWLLVPIMTCDCISRERREGTLGLLFLTPLRPVDVSIAKALSGIMRALTLILAVLPVIAIPLLLGGVSGKDLLRAAMMEIMSLIGAITAGLLASSRCREFSRASLLGMLYSAVVLIVLGSLQTIPAMIKIAGGAFGGPGQLMPWVIVAFSLLGPWITGSGWGNSWRLSPWATRPDTLWLSLWQILAAAFLLLATLLFLNRKLRRLAMETGMSNRQLWWWKTFCTPRVFTRMFHRINRGLLNRNPIGWLQRRTWTARLSTWGWLGILVMVESFLVTFTNQIPNWSWSNLMDRQPEIGLFIAAAMAFSAADSFRRERETGALELLLVTPLTVRQVVTGRLFGLWGQYLPVYLLMLGTWWYTASWQLWQNTADLHNVRLGMALIFTSTFILSPIIGLQQSLQRRHFFNAWFITALLTLIIPLLVPHLIMDTSGVFPSNSYTASNMVTYAVMVTLLQGAFAYRAAHKVHDDLTERRFALGN